MTSSGVPAGCPTAGVVTLTDMQLMTPKNLGSSPMKAINLNLHGRSSLAGDVDRVSRPILYCVRPKRFTSHDELHVQRLGRVLA